MKFGPSHLPPISLLVSPLLTAPQSILQSVLKLKANKKTVQKHDISDQL